MLAHNSFFTLLTNTVPSKYIRFCNYTSLHVLYLLDSCLNLRQLKRLHALVLKDGSFRDLTFSTKIITLASSFSPTMDYARNLFDRMSERNAFHWNILIRGYADKGPCQEAILLFRNMRRSGLLPDDYTFPSVVRACSVNSAFWEGRQVHCNAVKNGVSLDVFVQCSLVTMYSQSGETMKSELIFSEMDVRNIVSWTSLIAGYVQNGLFEKGLIAFRDMMSFGVQPNAVTLVSVLPACAGMEFWNLGKLIHAYSFKRGFIYDISLVNTLIALYSSCGHVNIARSLFDRMDVRSVVSWNAIIAAYEQNKAGGDAIMLFRRMQTVGIEYDYITLVSVISACASIGALDTGKWVHDLVRCKGLETNVSITSALIDMYAKCGNINLARDVFDRLRKRSVVTWTSIIGACASHGYGEDAVLLFSKMKEEGIKPNIYTFTAVLTACRHAGFVEEGRKHFESMTRDYLIVPGIEQYACMVDLLGRAGELNEAYKFINKMINADAGVWGALLGACRIHGNLELAEHVADRLYKLDPHSLSSYALMINIYAEAGRWEDVARMRRLIDEREPKRIPAVSSVEVNRRFHTSTSGLRT
ncbi:pentatricopeptide repeat-containing protein At2g29760, chloroplastic-like [Apium graveolens]|uniref:pentatricopeptide repeat-containing protein At2g29760, chloroplastic-like n=1 Tax=Apium graveolens TaxID=4045 RepID=UPI003D7BE66E